jgi:hypothetical protein
MERVVGATGRGGGRAGDGIPATGPGEVKISRGGGINRARAEEAWEG